MNSDKLKKGFCQVQKGGVYIVNNTMGQDSITLVGLDGSYQNIKFIKVETEILEIWN
jgi:hypothetical protein